MTQAVFFDVGQTLIRADPPVPDVFARVARRHGYGITVRDVEPCMADVDAYYQSEYLRDGEIAIDMLKAENAKQWADLLLLRMMDRITGGNDNLTLLTLMIK